MSFCRCGKFALISFNRILMSLVSVVVFSWILRGDLLLYPKCLRCVDIPSYLCLFFHHLNVILSWCFSLVESVAMLSLCSSVQHFSFLLCNALITFSSGYCNFSHSCCWGLCSPGPGVIFVLHSSAAVLCKVTDRFLNTPFTSSNIVPVSAFSKFSSWLVVIF